MTGTKRWKIFLRFLMLGYILFLVVSIYQVKTYAIHVQSYSMLVNRETREIRTRMDDMEISLTLMLSSPQLDYADVVRQLEAQRQTQFGTIARLKQNYPGDPALIDKLFAAMETMRQGRFKAAEQLRDNTSHEVAVNYFTANLKPLFEPIYKILDEINQSIASSAYEARKEIDFRLYLIIFFSAVVGFVILGMSILADRRERRILLDLAYRDKMFRLLVKSVDEVFIIAINSGSFEFVSPNFCRTLNLPKERTNYEPSALYELLEKGDAEWLKNILDEKTDFSETAERDVFIESTSRYYKIRVYPMLVPRSDLKRHIVVINDQTDILLQQQALNDALENARGASAAKSSFLTHMSHEIRTPMNAIIGMTTIAISKIDDKTKVGNCLGKIAESSRHLLGLINDVLDMSKIESGKLSIAREKFNLHRCIENVSNAIRPQIQDKRQNFEILLENVEEENFIGDSLRLNQILLNLLSNAYKFTPNGGRITLRIRQLARMRNSVRFRFAVSDTGIGMSEEFLQKLYEPFEQASPNTASRFGGTGLGMPITANLTALMGGTISVESKLGKGTTFVVELPFELSGEAAIKSNCLPHAKILIVDDDLGTCEHAALLLEKMGLKPCWTQSGAEAVEMAKKAHEEGNGYDVCLVDWKMPDMDGSETSRKIREAVGDDVMIIIISAYDWSPIESKAREAGVNDFVAKPFFASTLFDALVSVTKKLEAPDSGGAVQQGKPKFDFSGKRILLVEDNEFNREIAQEFLEMVNAEVDNAENGQEAVDKISASAPGDYDLVLMDVQMPIMNGYVATRHIRALDRPDAQDLVILAMTANAFSEDVALAAAAGMNGHIAKPIDVDELYRILDAHLRGKVSHQSSRAG